MGLQNHWYRKSAYPLFMFWVSGHVWQRVLPYLVQEHQVFIVDLPGYGRSTYSETRGPWRLREMAPLTCRMATTNASFIGSPHGAFDGRRNRDAPRCSKSRVSEKLDTRGCSRYAVPLNLLGTCGTFLASSFVSLEMVAILCH